MMYIFLFSLDCLLGKLTIEYSNVQRGGKKPTCFCEFDIQGGLVFEYIGSWYCQVQPEKSDFSINCKKITNTRFQHFGALFYLLYVLLFSLYSRFQERHYKLLKSLKLLIGVTNCQSKFAVKTLILGTIYNCSNLTCL